MSNVPFEKVGYRIGGPFEPKPEPRTLPGDTAQLSAAVKEAVRSLCAWNKWLHQHAKDEVHLATCKETWAAYVMQLDLDNPINQRMVLRLHIDHTFRLQNLSTADRELIEKMLVGWKEKQCTA